jgi:uncharacterized YccA/Bax inhibitor family protein
MSDGPISPWQPGMMTVQGTATKAGMLFLLLLASAVVGWGAAAPDVPGRPQFPSIALVGVVIGFASVIALYFKPMWAKFLGPVYALAQGFFVGAISRAYETWQDGIVLQAVGATVAVFAVMLFLHRSRILKVTDRFRRIVVTATMGVMALYVVSFVLRLFDVNVSFLNEPSALGIGFSVFVCVLAALNLSLDFDFIEKGSRMGLSKDYEWVGAVGLLVTIVWLYLEILRLLSKLQDR